MFFFSGWKLSTTRLKAMPRDPGQSRGPKLGPGLFFKTWESVLLHDANLAREVMKSIVLKPAEYVTSPGLGLAMSIL